MMTIEEALYLRRTAQLLDQNVSGGAIAIDNGPANQITYRGGVASFGHEIGDRLSLKAQVFLSHKEFAREAFAWILGLSLPLYGLYLIGSGRLTINSGSLDNTTSGPVVFGNLPQTWNGGFNYLGGSLLNLGTGPVTVNAATTITVQNMPGSGGLKLANYLYGEAPRDGSVFGTIGQS